MSHPRNESGAVVDRPAIGVLPPGGDPLTVPRRRSGYVVRRLVSKMVTRPRQGEQMRKIPFMAARHRPSRFRQRRWRGRTSGIAGAGAPVGDCDESFGSTTGTFTSRVYTPFATGMQWHLALPTGDDRSAGDTAVGLDFRAPSPVLVGEPARSAREKEYDASGRGRRCHRQSASVIKVGGDGGSGTFCVNETGQPRIGQGQRVQGLMPTRATAKGPGPSFPVPGYPRAAILDVWITINGLRSRRCRPRGLRGIEEELQVTVTHGRGTWPRDQTVGNQALTVVVPTWNSDPDDRVHEPGVAPGWD